MTNTNLSRPHFASQAIPTEESLDPRKKIERVLFLTQSANPEIPLIAKIVEETPELAGLVVHAVNSSETGLNYRIDSPKHAVAMLGPRRVRELAERIKNARGA